MTSFPVDSPDDLDAAAVLAVADGATPVLGAALVARLDETRRTTLAALDEAGPVYGVTTGMGHQSNLAVGATDQPAYQGDLMLARSVGTAPWLDDRTARAALAVRLRTLLDAETGASPALAKALVALLEAGVRPAVPATGNGAAGEIIPLAHLGGLLTGSGQGLDASGATVDASVALADAGLAPYALGAKEGVALLQGVPVATARAVLLAHDARLAAAGAVAAWAGEVAATRAPRDPFHPALARGDGTLAAVHAALLDLAGDETTPHLLQAPVSFRVTGPAVAHLLRAVDHLDAAVTRALEGVTTSPALVDGRFLGTAGFDGFDLAAGADAVRVAVLHLAEVGAARMHRMLDARVTGLAPQLSGAPGRQAGLVALHKRAAGLVHAAVRGSAPASLGAIETSLGQEDVQSYALEAAAALADAVSVLRDVTACELVAVHRARALDEGVPIGTDRLNLVLRQAFEHLPSGTGDRAFGQDVGDLRHDLGVGWAHDVLYAILAPLSRPAHESP